MEKVFATKDERSEFYAKIEVGDTIWKFLEQLAFRLFSGNSVIPDHYQGQLPEEDYFSFEKDGVRLTVIMAGKRAHVIVLGLPDNQSAKEILFKHYSFKPEE